jgi:high-affinity Fe2+/Pb2+ permease
MLELIGLLLPPFIDIINRRVKDSDVRFVISIVVCVLIGLLLNFVENGSHLGNQNAIATSILTVFGASQLTYKGIWENSKARAAMLGANREDSN